jgi:hypothetical protein
VTDRPIHERDYRAFLSHAHADKALVDQLHDLLARSAGLPIWYDSTSLQAPRATSPWLRLPTAFGIIACKVLMTIWEAKKCRQ